MSETGFRDLIARIAIDPDAAAMLAERLPELVAELHLSPADAAWLSSLAASHLGHSASRIGKRLSESPLMAGSPAGDAEPPDSTTVELRGSPSPDRAMTREGPAPRQSPARGGTEPA